jgi:tetratricopeptide (TPR) repeat protein
MEKIHGADSIACVRELVFLGTAEGMIDETRGSPKARATLERALAILDRIPSAPASMRASVLRDLAILEHNAGDLAVAVRHADEALGIAEKAANTESITAAGFYLAHAMALGPPSGEEARGLASLRKALAIYEKLDPDDASYGAALTEMADQLADLKRTREAIGFAERAIAALSDDNAPYNLALARKILGSALARSHGGGARARAELAQARAGFAALGRHREITEIDATLAKLSRSASPDR